MNPIMQGLNQPAQPQQGIASLAPQQPTQPSPAQPIQDHMDRSIIGNGIYDMMGNNPLMGIDPGVGPDPSAPTDQFGNTIGWNPPPINMFPSQPPGYQPPGVQPGPGMGTFDHLTDNPYVQGQPDNFITIEGVKYYDDGSTQQAPTAPPNFQPAIPHPGTGMPNPQPGMPFQPPQTNYSPGVQPPGWQNTQPFDPNQGNLGILPGGSHFDESSNNPYGINQGIASLAGTNPGI